MRTGRSRPTSALWLRHPDGSDPSPFTPCTLTLQRDHPHPQDHLPIKLQAVRTSHCLDSPVQQTGRPKSTEGLGGGRLGTGDRGQETGDRGQGPGTRSLKLSWSRSPPQQHTRPQPSSPLSWLLCPLFPLFPDPPPPTPTLARGLTNTFWLFHEYIDVFSGGARGSLRGMSSLVVAPAAQRAGSPWQNAAGPVLPPSSS